MEDCHEQTTVVLAFQKLKSKQLHIIVFQLKNSWQVKHHTNRREKSLRNTHLTWWPFQALWTQGLPSYITNTFLYQSGLSLPYKAYTTSQNVLLMATTQPLDRHFRVSPLEGQTLCFYLITKRLCVAPDWDPALLILQTDWVLTIQAYIKNSMG
jgi:hypothetical protein